MQDTGSTVVGDDADAGRRLRTVDALVGIAYAVQAVIVGVVVSTVGARVLLPVTATFTAGPTGASSEQRVHVDIAAVDLGVAVLVLLAAGAIVRFALLVPALAVRRSEATAVGRNTVRWAEWSQVSAVTVFLVAQLNGITEVTSLVPVYAMTASAVLLLALQERSGGGAAGRRLAAVAAVVGIVPWGVIAFAQIGATVTSGAPAVTVRIITLAMLAIAVAVWAFVWRAGRRPVAASGVADEVTYLGVALLGTGTFAWLAVGGIVLPSAL
ncbi:hypothetical protein EDM22_04540 [Agromyces tardus]|uniref:Uncharacterized protein n=1 Tax=Agromyces tardus TaxID=2583849 RepID=A0A3M8AJJ5_9MICO|nr:hypothetical protein [Agromyces tardus]RNB51303.1 hypothetical protein EDM22_04540 [Agromyces tardus]